MTGVLLIVHPKAGGGRGSRMLPEIVAALRAGGADVVSQLTRDIDHAGALAAEAAREGLVAVALGGDGLAGRVAGTSSGVGGLFAALPGGRGNDFVRGLGIDLDPVKAAEQFHTWEERAVDIGHVTGPDGSPTPLPRHRERRLRFRRAGQGQQDQADPRLPGLHVCSAAHARILEACALHGHSGR